MQQKIDRIQSNNLEKEVNVSVYGHFGTAIVFFPTNTGSHKQLEETGLIAKLEPTIKKGKCKIYCPEVPYQDLRWADELTDPHNRSKMHYEFNEFILNDLLPYIFDDCGSPVPMITAGADIGAYNAANTYFRRPDVFAGTIALSGDYNLQNYTKGYFDENCYFNSPVHYLPNLNDTYWLTHLLSRKHVYLISGSGENENPGNTEFIGGILNSKNIPNNLIIKDNNYGKNFEAWNEIFDDIISMKL
jgi:esterase/lipase superfamily enzyme